MLEQRFTVALFLTAAGLLPTSEALAQSTPKFEVASVKEASESRNGVRGGCHGINSVYTPTQQAEAPPLGRCVITDARLSHLIGIAFGINMQSLKTSPDWIQRGDLRFHVEAKAADPSKATEQELLTMLQNLLVERFQLKFHLESSEAPGFTLQVAKNGPKLTVSHSQDTTVFFTGPKGETMGKPVQGERVVMSARKYSMAGLVNVLTVMGNGPGLDKTGLVGEYDFMLSWDENAGPDLSTALREQLGLRIDTTKVPTSTFVVDSAQKPTAN